MCTRGAWCVDRAKASSWWAAPLLLGRDGDRARYVVEDQDGRLEAREARRRLPSTVSLVLTFGGVTPERANQPSVLSEGGVVVRMTHQERALSKPEGQRTVPVRGHVAFVAEATSMTTGRKYRAVEWSIRSGKNVIVYLALDDPKRRSLDELVHLLDTLGEA